MIEYTQTSSYIPENRSNSVLSGKQRPLNVGKSALRRSQFWTNQTTLGRKFLYLRLFLNVQTANTNLQSLLSVRLWQLEALFSGFLDFFDPKITGICHLGRVADEVGQFSTQIGKAHVLSISNQEKKLVCIDP